MRAAESPNDSSALIGGIVGGAVALLLVGALVAFCVVRQRRQSKDDAAEQPTALARSDRDNNDGPIELAPKEGHYDAPPARLSDQTQPNRATVYSSTAILGTQPTSANEYEQTDTVLAL
jgi:hypothetical protein